MKGEILRGRRALVTGASGGLGADFARELAARGCHLVLVARRAELLAALKAEITAQHKVEVDTITLDLVAAEAPQQLYDQLKADGKAIDVLINNAGHGLYGKFLDIPWPREHDMLELDIVAVVHMTKLFVADMVKRNFGFVLQIASIGAYQPSPLYASYSAAKSFVLNFGEALNYELRRTKVRCTVLSPGVTATDFLKVAGQKATWYQRRAMMQSKDVVRIGIDSMVRGKSSVVPGLLNAVMVWSNRLMPRRLSAAVASRLMQ